MAGRGYNAVSVTGPKERCSSCELLNILGKPKYGQKRCKECIEKENKKKMKMKHIPVHLRKRNLTEQTEKASRILVEETGGDAANGGEEGMFGSGAAHRNADEEETVKLSDILEITFELLDLVDGHVHRTGSLDEVARFESQIKVLRSGRDNVRTQLGHIEDKRAIILAFSIFTEHYTLLVRDYEKLVKKNTSLKQLAYDTAGLVKKSEAQFESYVSELKQMQGTNANINQTTKIELTKLRNEVTGLKLELNLRTNELREMQLESNTLQETMRRERERSEEMRKDKDHRITSLLAQLQQFSLDYAHEKSERLRLERENERLWTDRMAYRAEQIRGKNLTAAERTLAAEKDAIEKREWLEWKKKAALRDLAAKERMRTEAWEVRRNVEQDAQVQMDRIRRELGTAIGSATTTTNAEETTARHSRKDREYWMENEVVPSALRTNVDHQLRSDPIGFPPNLSPISSPTSSTINAQRWNARMARQAEEEEIDAQIEQLRLRNEQTQLRSSTYPPPPMKYTSDVPVTGVVRAGGYGASVESVLTNERSSPALPYFADTPASALTWQNPPSLQPNARNARNYTSTNPHPAAVSYQPMTAAAAIPPPTAPYQPPPAPTAQPTQQQQQLPATAAVPAVDATAEIKAQMEQQIRDVQRQIDHLHAENSRRATAVVESALRPSSAHASAGSTDFVAIEAGLRRSRQIRGESARVATTATSTTRTNAAGNTRTTTQHDDDEEDERDEEYRRQKQRTASRKHETRSLSPSSDDRSRSVSRDRERDRARARSRADHAAPHARRSDRPSGDRHRSDRPRRHDRATSSSSASDSSDVDDGRRHRRQHRHRSNSRDRQQERHRKLIDGREAVPIRNMTLYSVRD